MKANTERRKQGLDEKIPDIQKTLETVRFLKTRKVITPSDTIPHWHSTNSVLCLSARCRTPRGHIRAKRHTLRESARTAYGGSLPMAGCERDALLPDRGSRDTA